MRKFFITLTFVFAAAAAVFSQTPQAISYQAVARNLQGEVLVNQNVNLRISILAGSTTGNAVYVETHALTTNQFGLINLQIGKGTPQTGTFDQIDWADNSYFSKIEIDNTGGNNFVEVGISEILAVPYALHSKTVDKVDYSQIENTPTVPADVSELTDNSSLLFSGDYNDLTNTPTMFDGKWTSIKNTPTTIEGYSITDAFSGDYNDLTNTPTMFDGKWTSITNTPTTIEGYSITDAYQTLSVNGNELSISGKAGNTVTLPTGSASSNLDILTSEQIAALTPENGQTVFNATESLYQIYDGTKWIAIPADCWPQPTTANAGSNQYFSDGTLSTSLTANAPEAQHGTGAWTIISGEGGIIDDTTNPNATFTGQLYEMYELQWSITTSCDISTDNVTIFFGQNGPGETVTDADGNTYNTVWIGTQTWMAENLKTTKYNDGTDIPNVTDNTEWSNLTTPAYAWYDNDEATYKNQYGALYNWYVVETGNVCPTGWHVPTDEEWTILTDYLAANGHSGTEGTALKSISGWYSDGNGTDNYGFTALPGGYRNAGNGSFYNAGKSGRWWSRTPYGSENAYRRDLFYDYGRVYRYWHNRKYGFSVRCVKD